LNKQPLKSRPALHYCCLHITVRHNQRSWRPRAALRADPYDLGSALSATIALPQWRNTFREQCHQRNPPCRPPILSPNSHPYPTIRPPQCCISAGICLRVSSVPRRVSPRIIRSISAIICCYFCSWGRLLPHVSVDATIVVIGNKRLLERSRQRFNLLITARTNKRLVLCDFI
jgi:hypothetical protein